MARKTRTRIQKHRRSRKLYRKQLVAGNIRLKQGGACNNDTNCNKSTMSNNRNNLPYFPYISREVLNSGFQYGNILQKKGGSKHKTSKRGGSCNYDNKPWIRGAYPVVIV